MALFTPESRDQTAARVAKLLETDDRVEGVVLVGSLAGRADRWSDIDLEIVVRDDVDAAGVAGDWTRDLYEDLPVVHHFETTFGSTRVHGLLLDDALEVDLSFTTASVVTLWEPARPMFDRNGRVADALARSPEWSPTPPKWTEQAGFAWHDALHAATALRRGRRWQSLWYMERVRNRTLTLAQERRGFFADFFDYVDDLPAEEFVAVEPTLIGSLDPDVIRPAIEAATRAFLAELRHGDAELSERLSAPLLTYVTTW